MTDALIHRGPDGEGLGKMKMATVLLGHRRLSIIDLSKGGATIIQCTSKSWAEGTDTRSFTMERFTITLRLKKELEKEGYSFHTQSDTEVILAAYDLLG